MERRKKITKIILITITLLFLLLMLAAPLLSVLVNSLKEGIGFYVQAISTPYVVSALLVTLLATVIAVVVNTFFWNLCGMALDEVFVPGQTDFSYTD